MTGQDHSEALDTEGFAHIAGVLSAADLEPVRAEYRHLLQILTRQWGEEGRLPAGCGLSDIEHLAFEDQLLVSARRTGFDPALLAELDITLPHMPFSVIRPDVRCHVGDALLGLLTHPRVLEVVGDVLGERLMASPNQHCRLKLPAITTRAASQRLAGRPGETLYEPTIWHQDAMTQMPQSDATPIVTCWIPMVDVDERNGCLLVVPGEHHVGQLLPWPMDPATVERLTAAAVAVPARAGDVVLLHKRTPHASLPNRSAGVRWSFDFRYLPAGAPVDRPWYPYVQVRPSDAGFDAAAWRQRWVDARDMLIARGQPLPGRREFATMVAQGHMGRWDDGDFPVLEGQPGG